MLRRLRRVFHVLAVGLGYAILATVTLAGAATAGETVARPAARHTGVIAWSKRPI